MNAHTAAIRVCRPVKAGCVGFANGIGKLVGRLYDLLPSSLWSNGCFTCLCPCIVKDHEVRVHKAPLSPPHVSTHTLAPASRRLAEASRRLPLLAYLAWLVHRRASNTRGCRKRTCWAS